MATQTQIIAEIRDAPGAPDLVRRKYIKQLSELTGRPTVLYAAAVFTNRLLPPGVEPLLAIDNSDMQGFMSALYEVKGDQLDLILHSPGGTAEATEQIVNYLRAKFKDIRVIVPQNAMSAATMLACAANRIVMGKHSALGPIDPQFYVGNYTAAAQSIIEEFQLAMQSVQGGGDPLLWVKKLEQYPPGFLVDCHKVIHMAKVLVQQWLEKWMFAGDHNAKDKSTKIAEWLGKNENHLTHGRAIGMKDASDNGLIIEPLEGDQKLQDAVLSVFHATMATFQMTDCIKLIENHLGAGHYTSAPTNV